MKKILSGKYILIFLILLTAGISTGFLASQDTREFRIAKNLEIFFNLFRELNTFYVDDINPDKIMKTGIDNMLKTLDPYTVYMPEDDANEFKIITTGKYGGIGSLVRSENDYTVVSEVYKGFPADQAGIKAGDILKKVDGQSLKGLASDKVSEKLKGEPGTPIKLTVERNGTESDYDLKREKIAIPSVPYYGMIDGKTGYIRFTNFTQNCIEEVRNALIALKKNNPDQIILDLRGNPGGLLSEAVEIVNLFVGPGNEVVTTKGKIKQNYAVYKTTRQAVDEKIPLAVVINQGSASASEIVAGAIQDLDRGIIIGQRSYGKGLVQITRPLNYNTQLKVTTAKYYIPSGRCIQAIDFSHRNEDGSVGYIADSLTHEFKTRNGRTVKDGGGITPDVDIQAETLSQITAELYLRNFIFDFATQYYWSHPDIKTPDQFNFTEKDYADFTNFLKSKNFNYKTETEDSFNELVKTAKKEKYYDIHKDAFSSLEKEITHSLDDDLALFRPEITNLIEDEIVSRYFYQEGALAWSVKKDEQVQKALEVLSNKDLYTSILQGKSGALMMTKIDSAPVIGSGYVNKMSAVKSNLLSSVKRG
jgi:carboxyl-terminal processing protease